MKTCSIVGCDKKHFGKGFCNTHYNRFRRNGSATVLLNESHNLTKSPEYKVWQDMKTRCSNPNHDAFIRYGGRGIEVCYRWENSFLAFYNDMGKRPENHYQIDRIDNNGNYEPGNCQWVTAKQNARKRTSTKLNMEKATIIRSLKDKMSQPDLAKMFNVCSHTISDILTGRTWREDII